MPGGNSRTFGRSLLSRALAAAPPVLWRPLERWRSAAFWRRRKKAEGALGNAHFEFAFTSLFGLDRPDFTGKAVLDIGCGPRGSLEWAEDAIERVGLDPAADSFLEMGADQHAMRYLPAVAEDIPVYDGRFDIVSILNVLDRVDDPEQAIAEAQRVTKPGGMILLMSVINHDAPGKTALGARRRFGPELIERFELCAPERVTLNKLRADNDVYRSAFEAERLADDTMTIRGVLCARLRRGPDAS